MIFNLVDNYTPEAYSKSRDYRVLLRQLGIIISVLKYNIDHFPDLYDADYCPDHLLPLLASMVGYTYNEDKSVKSNRKIIKSYPYLLRNRGSELGIKLATILSINTSPYVNRNYSMNNIVVSCDSATGFITIYYPDTTVVDWSLIEVVRPVGTRIKLVPSSIGELSEELDLKVTARGISHSEYYDQSRVGNSRVNYDVVTKDTKES